MNIVSKTMFKFLTKYADNKEVDSSDVTMTVRPIVNKVMSDFQLESKLLGIVNEANIKSGKENITLEGYLEIGEPFYITATYISNKWKVDTTLTKFHVEGNLLDNKYIKTEIVKLFKDFYTKLFLELEAELNRLHTTFSNNVPGCNKITNNKVFVNQIKIDV